MPEKKKSPISKAAEKRMTKPHAAETSGTTGSGGALPTDRAAVLTRPAGSRQLTSFEAAMKLFHARKLKEAREMFRAAAEGPERDVAQRARLHVAMCDRRLEQPAVHLRSAEDYYNYSVALLNTRNAAEARIHLEKALEISPRADHIHYALALARAMGGDPMGAYESLKRAIELEPRNRIIARQDADFAPLASQPPFDGLLYPEKKGW